MTASAERVPDTEPKTNVFISYSRKDQAFADRLEAALKVRGFEPLIDRGEIYAFEDWWNRIEALIGRADTVVFVLSPDAAKSEVALKEVAYAASLNKRFAPIVCRRVADGAIPAPLQRLNFIFFDDPARLDASADELAEALETDIAWIRRHTEFGEAARRWIESSRASGLLLRPPMLDQAEAWMAFRPRGAPEPTTETEAFIAASRKAEITARRRSRILSAALYTMFSSIILGLIGWINQDFLIAEYRWITITYPYALSHVRPYVLSAAQARALKPGDSFKECARDCPEMVVIPAGSFTMGSPKFEPAHLPSDEPQHTVTFATPFAVSRYELTFSSWDACVTGGGCNGYKPPDQDWGRGQQPAINVSWNDAQQYVLWLSQVTRKTYRLLSEAEYEYAARAGATTIFPWGDEIKLNGTAMANCNGCGSKWDTQHPAPVGSFPSNGFGLYDMVGNVGAWVADCMHSNYNGAPTDGSAWITSNSCDVRVIRGSGYGEPTFKSRSAQRIFNAPGGRYVDLGFRVARALDER
jgi:formylglycine-generating enzyme required for sulfatase activity